jgi:hypothetical protein
MSARTAERARRAAELAMSLAALMADSEDAQWQAGRTPTPREDTTERSRGMVSDPTPSIVGDRRRQELRAAHDAADAALGHAITTLRDAGQDLQYAVDRWHGEGDGPQPAGEKTP